jgi:quercetin dioxygenase-like cupin family protein
MTGGHHFFNVRNITKTENNIRLQTDAYGAALLKRPFGEKDINTEDGTMMTMTPPVMRKELLTAIITGGKHVTKVEIQEVTMNVGIDAPLHLHPCPTVGVVMEGKIVFEIEGGRSQRLKVGDAFYEPADIKVAKFNNDGDTPAKFVVFYLLGENEKETVRILEK